MAGETFGAVPSIRLLMDILKANKTLTNYNELVAAVSEVNAELISAQAATLASQKNELALTQRIGELEKEVSELKNWDREAERYQLTDIGSGLMALTVKPGMESGEAPHRLCADCFARREKSFLQPGPSTKEVSCGPCKKSWHLGGGKSATMEVISLKRG